MKLLCLNREENAQGDCEAAEIRTDGLPEQKRKPKETSQQSHYKLGGKSCKPICLFDLLYITMVFIQTEFSISKLVHDTRSNWQNMFYPKCHCNIELQY